jgi:predicted negative regulator of RcsB-dependent stress response
VLGWLLSIFKLIVRMGRIFSMWVSLALLAGAILAAYGFFVWRYVEQQRKQSTTMTRTKRRPF